MDVQTILGAIGLGVTVLLFLVGIIIKQGALHRSESNKRLDEHGTRIDSCTRDIGQVTIGLARIESDVQHIGANVDGLTRWKDQLQEETIARLREERDRPLPAAIASAARGRRRADGGDV